MMVPRLPGHTGPRCRGRQRGAALIIGLLLLLVLTLLAISGMRSASEELIMAGNEQYRQNAFQAAEAGVEQAIERGTFVGGSAVETVTGTVGGSEYTATITPQLGGLPSGTIAGSSSDSAAGISYEVASVGNSFRGAQVTTWQGLLQPVPAGRDSFSADAELGDTF
jgi:hypothetical protein